jgi:hypothetical protein
MAQKTPDPAVEQLPAVGVVGVALPPPSFSDLRPTVSRLDTRRSCAPAAPNTRTTFFGVGGRAWSRIPGARSITLIGPFADERAAIGV